MQCAVVCSLRLSVCVCSTHLSGLSSILQCVTSQIRPCVLGGHKIPSPPASTGQMKLHLWECVFKCVFLSVCVSWKWSSSHRPPLVLSVFLINFINLLYSPFSPLTHLVSLPLVLCRLSQVHHLPQDGGCEEHPEPRLAGL